MNQQKALVKLATVRLAINHVLRMRAMQKQAGSDWLYNMFTAPRRAIDATRKELMSTPADKAREQQRQQEESRVRQRLQQQYAPKPASSYLSNPFTAIPNAARDAANRSYQDETMYKWSRDPSSNILDKRP